MKSIFRAQEVYPPRKGLSDAVAGGYAQAKLLGMDVRLEAMPCVVDARGHTVAAISFYARATSAQSGQEDNRAEGK